MDNQQERLELEMAWLAGFFEGEGHISLCKCANTSKKSLGRPRYVPMVGLCNTDYAVLPDVKRVLDLSGITYCIYESKINGIGKKPKWELNFKGMEKAYKFCNWILPYLKGYKKLRAEKIIKFCDMRWEKLKISHQAPYGIEEESIYKDMYSFTGKTHSKILNDFTSCAV
jgi:hypothetical protein